MMKRFLACGAALFVAAAAAPTFASDVSDDTRESRQERTTKFSGDEACAACAMHARHVKPDSGAACHRQQAERSPQVPEFTDRG